MGGERGGGQGFARWIPSEALLLPGLVLRPHDKVREFIGELCRGYSETAPRHNIGGQ